MKLGNMFKKTNQKNYITLTNGKANVQNSGESSPEVPEGLMRKCNACRAVVLAESIIGNQYICPKCGNYFSVPARRRIEMLADEESFKEWDTGLTSGNPLHYKGYEDKVEALREKTGLDEAVTTGLARIGGHEVVLAVTQPDKPKGRGKSMQFPPVKEAALEHGIEVYQPRRVREPECVEYLRSFDADIIVVVAFGQILPKEILEMPKYGCVNVHASLLPKYRGAAPIQWAVINGEKVSGVTTMRMDEGLDTGDMILKEEVVLDEKETGGSLFDRLSGVGAKLCVRTLEAIEDGTAIYTKQDHAAATKTTLIKKQFGIIDWNKPAAEIECLIRGLNPWPSAYTYLNGKTLKIWAATVKDETSDKEPGELTEVTKHSVGVQTGDGILMLEEVQLEGKKRMSADAFLRGNALSEGMKLGE